MRVVTNDSDLDLFLKTAAVVSNEHPVVISKYIIGAKEVEMDAVGKAGELVNYAIAEHIENAGVHSGDATLLLPAQRLFVETHRRIKSITTKLCRALKISGPFNIQFICKENEVQVIECNLRASRSLPSFRRPTTQTSWSWQQESCSGSPFGQQQSSQWTLTMSPARFQCSLSGV